MTERGALLGGRYALDQIIGRGGMAEVWRARDMRLQRNVAVKRLRVDLASDPTFQARFRREAQSAAGLNHPNIVAVYDTGEEKDPASEVTVPYIVMELITGVTLREVLRDDRKIVPAKALEFAAGVLDALAYSHREGIIHRDIKPANVMLTPGGTVKVMDFGIARAVADTSATMTQTAAVIGTAQYLSPEQARGEKVDNRSDIYAVGCLLYELLTSQPLFQGDSPVSVAYQHVREAPIPPSQVDPEVTPDMDAIVLKSLAKDPRDRYQDASEMREDIFRVLNHQPVLASLPLPAEQATQVVGAEPVRSAALATVPGGAEFPMPEEPQDAEPEKRKKRRGLAVVGILTVLVLIAMGIAVAMVLNNRPAEPETVAIPTVIGQNELAAKTALTDQGLKPVVKYQAGTESNENQVLDQDPKQGTQVEKGSTVNLIVSSGVELKKVPEGLVGLTYAKAKEKLVAAGFKNVSEVEAKPETEDTSAKKGTVTGSQPDAGAEVSPNTQITLTVATGRSIVPRLTGLTTDEARKEAKKSGFRILVEEVPIEGQTPGQVYEQDPLHDRTASRGTKIKVKVAVAPPSPNPVPSPTPSPPVSPPATETPPVVEPTDTLTPVPPEEPGDDE